MNEGMKEGRKEGISVSREEDQRNSSWAFTGNITKMAKIVLFSKFFIDLQSKYSACYAYYLGLTFINRERITLLESKFHFRIEYCNVPTVAQFQIRNADWFIIDIRRMFTCK